jgi:hypothetical protein
MTEPRGSVLVMAPSQAQPDPCVYCGIDKTRTRCAHQTQSMFDALAQVCRALEGFGAEDQRRILKACRILAAPVPPPLVFGDITKSNRPPVVDQTGRTAITYDDFTNAAAEIAGWATAEQRLDAKLAAHTPGDAMNLKPDEANVLRERAALVRVKPAFQRMVNDFSTDAANTVGEAMRRNVSHGAGMARQDQQLPDLHPGDKVWWRGVLRTVANVTADQNRGRYAVEFVEVNLAVQLAQREIGNLRANYVMPHPDTIEWSTAPFTAEEGAAAEKLGFSFELHRPEVRAKARRAIAMQAYRGAENFARCRRQCPHGDRCTREDGHKEDADINSTMYPPRVGCTLASCVCGKPTAIRHAVGCNEPLCLGCGDQTLEVDVDRFLGKSKDDVPPCKPSHESRSRSVFQCSTCQAFFCSDCRTRIGLIDQPHLDRPLKTVGFTCKPCDELHDKVTGLCEVIDCIRCMASRPRDQSQSGLHACKVCQSQPDEHGVIEHGKGCYTQNDEGGGTSYVELTEHERRVIHVGRCLDHPQRCSIEKPCAAFIPKKPEDDIPF